jgi:hypothetical protein
MRQRGWYDEKKRPMAPRGFDVVVVIVVAEEKEAGVNAVAVAADGGEAEPHEPFKFKTWEFPL